MDYLFVAFCLILAAFFSVYWAKIISIRLPELLVWFDRKPFNCRPCLTFHLAWMQSALLASITNCLPFLILGLVQAFVLFIVVKYIDNKKITK